MRVLALDTTTRSGSVALVDDEHVIAERCGDATLSHAERLPGDVLRLLESVGQSMAGVDLFAVAAGPGSFTGLRIGIATMQGLAFVKGSRMVSVSSLEALAHVAADGLAPGSLVGAWMDAARREVFSALYRIEGDASGASSLVVVEAASVTDPAATLARWAGNLPAVLIGDGAVAYRNLVEPRTAVRDAPALAGVIGRMAAARARLGQTIDPAAVMPVYVRRPDAEIERDRRTMAGLGAHVQPGER